jgi:peptidoglycan hydrolase CwlO-like protein
MSLLKQIVHNVLRKLSDVSAEEERIMTAIDDLNTAVTALQAEDALVAQAFAALNTQIATLNTAVANAANPDPAIETAAQAVQAEVTKLQGMITPPAPAAS